MANNKRPTRSEEWREKIKIGVLVDRLYVNALGNLKDTEGKPMEITASQMKSIEILLKKTIPDLKAVEHSGETKSTTIVIQEYKEPTKESY